jgi:2-oxoglutarate dehydrogenase E1 component
VSAFGFNTGYVEELYSLYLEDPEAVSESWREFFEDYHPRETFLAAAESRRSTSGDGDRIPSDDSEPVRVQPPEIDQEGDGDGAVEKVKGPTPARDLDNPEVTPLRGPSATVAKNMEKSLNVPTATSVREVPVKLMAENRRLINDYQRYVGGEKISYTHIIAWAILQALQEYPNMNSAYQQTDGTPEHVQPNQVNLGLAIDIEKKDGSRSLLVPNIKGADKMSFAQFVGAYSDIVYRARNRKLELSDFAGTTVTLTNPGMIGTVMSVPRLMEGQGLILAVGSIGYPVEYQAMPPKEVSKLGVSEVMTITSTYDHRVIQGAESGAFLSHIAELLQGEHDFYDNIFSDLHIPHPPLSFAHDTSPALGRRRTQGLSEENRTEKQAQVLQLIRAYRVRGHMLADLNPLSYESNYHPELDPSTYGLTIWDLDREWLTGGLGGKEVLPLREILNILWETYTRTAGVEYMHISDPTEKLWLQERIEPARSTNPIPIETKRRILYKLNAAEAFERFLHTKYVGHKRFSLEGAETLIPILDLILSDAADQEVDEAVIGMAHRGRLNVLANTLGKPYEAIFSEFEGNIDPSTTQGSGDVKYHLGARGVHEAPSGTEIELTLASNPSHLEAVNPVVEGMTRAKQEILDDSTRSRVLPILVHGDAAFSGQGVVGETLNLSQLQGYRTGGTVHIVVNNQIGFTTSPTEARSSFYATDLARMIQAPIFHVNGDDPEGAVRIARLALDYRQVFNKDVVIDLVCYRKHGHNEADEPAYTQPLLYKKIDEHRSVRKLYTEALLRRGVLDPDAAETMLDDYRDRLKDAFERTKELEDQSEVTLQPFVDQDLSALQQVESAAKRDDLETVVKALADLPEELNVHRKLKRQFEQRKELYHDDGRINWGFAEALAFGSLLLEGTRVRLSGQDSRRGTFSHRHAVIYDQETGDEYMPLNNLAEDQPARLQIFDSLLSEYAALGFEYGYSVADPSSLVIWEAQFGDFANGAQIVWDQFISAAEEKWGQTSNVVALLPHGYEGQGPEHSSARLERFLQMAAEENILVCNFTTPANYFHALRRQVKADVQKPLIVMAPKSLLRHREAVSHPDALTDGDLQKMIPAAASPKTAERLIFCSGKVYYDLLEALRDEELTDRVAVTRIEQLYPLPDDQVREELNRFGQISDIRWVQEEPRNMGAWTYMQERLNDLLRETSGDPCAEIAYVGRPESASPATGSAKIHKQVQNNLVEEAITLE